MPPLPDPSDDCNLSQPLGFVYAMLVAVPFLLAIGWLIEARFDLLPN